MNKIEELKSQGYDFQGQKILAATTRRVAKFSVPALSLNFASIHDAKGKIVKHGWTAVTRSQAMRLKDISDPVTSEPYLRFAYVPVPDEWIKKESSSQVERVDLVELNKSKSSVEDIDFGDAKEDEAIQTDLIKSDAEYDSEFEQVQKESEERLALSEQTIEEKASDNEGKKPITSSQLEREELKIKSMAELRGMVKDIGLEVHRGATKEELIELICG